MSAELTCRLFTIVFFCNYNTSIHTWHSGEVLGDLISDTLSSPLTPPSPTLAELLEHCEAERVDLIGTGDVDLQERSSVR